MNINRKSLYWIFLNGVRGDYYWHIVGENSLKASDIRRILSTKLLDMAENISVGTLSGIKPLYGHILQLKKIRRKQREKAAEATHKRQPTKNTSIKLSRIVLSLIFEYEDFKFIKKSLDRLKPLDDRILENLEKIKNSSDRFAVRHTAYIGTIATRDTINTWNPFGKIRLIAKPPKNADCVSVSYFRPMPSVAFLNFEFNLSDDVSNEIDKILKHEYLSDITFNKFFKIKQSFRFYAESYIYAVAKNAADKYKNLLRSDFENWIIKNFKLGQKDIKQISFTDLYQVCENPRVESELQQWKKDNTEWLECHGISRQSYHSDEKLYAWRKLTGRYGFVHTLAKLEPHIKEHTDSTKDDIEGIGIVNALLSLVKKYDAEIDSLNNNGFDKISSWWQIWKPTSVVKIKKLKARIERYKNDFEDNKETIKQPILQLNLSKQNIYSEQEVNLAEKIIEHIEYRIKEMEKNIKILDTGLTEIISNRNTIAMFWLTLVVGIATIVGVFK